MITINNSIGAVVILGRSLKMPTKTHLVVLDYNKGDCGSKYKPMIFVLCEHSKQAEWVYVSCVIKVLNYGSKAINSSISKSLLLKQISYK